MASGPRERMIESAIVLLARHGEAGASFERVIERSKAPRGSIYHHFPHGKEELTAAAIDLAGKRAIAVLDRLEGRAPADVVDAFMTMWRAVLERSDLCVGCSVLAVTVSSADPDLVTRAGSVFRAWRRRLAQLFVNGGIDPARAEAFAATVVAASEGAVVLSRAEHSFEPFDLVGDQLRDQANRQLT